MDFIIYFFLAITEILVWIGLYKRQYRKNLDSLLWIQKYGLVLFPTHLLPGQSALLGNVILTWRG